jgi:long-chain acyl-CoA synthetase
VPIPLYQDAVATEMAFVMEDADIQFFFAENQEQVDKLLEVRESVPSAPTSFTTTRAACATTTSPA